ncbi:MAG: cysteine--tRNA ligase [Acidimicrobiales bacterium]|jgi:cysteinyl-tRNA synthetase|nr:cysteine--tRNA ligase [Acidimicrobiales bacterium]
MLQLFDTARGRVVPFETREPGKVSMYVCGPTVYGPPHLGHGRFSLVFDVLRRYLEWSGYEVTYVSNITDIDDNIINRANREGRTSEAVAHECEASWWEAMDAIGVKRPTHDPHATAYVQQMVALIAELVERGSAYVSDDGVYFSPEVVDDYGLLARQSLESLRAGARVDVAEHKRSPVDFALWKLSKPGEPSWPSPWGPGRPGWHTECVVMSLHLLGDAFDLHGGGQDLAFPHHENERAQAVAAGRTFAAHWVHNGFVEVGGEKMSKSLGNYTDLLDLVAHTDHRAYRLLVLRAHYRSPVEVTPATTDDASAALARLDAFARRAAALPAVEPDAGVLAELRRRMDDDLDTPGAVELLFTSVRRANLALDEGDQATAASLASAVHEICAAVGLELRAGGVEVPAELVALARRRDEARAGKDWATADALRDEIQVQGYVVEDTPEGTKVRPA